MVDVTDHATGMVLERQDRDRCDDCRPEEMRTCAIAFRAAGRAKLEALRADGQDPAHSDAANRRRGEKVAQRQREVRQWDAANGGEADPEVFRREILPRLQTVSLGRWPRRPGCQRATARSSGGESKFRIGGIGGFLLSSLGRAM
jgi:hypothetical protein